MNKSVLATTLGAAALAFALSACDQQQADSGDGVTAPIQQQGAVPAEPATTGGTEAVPSAIPAQPNVTEDAPQDGVPVQSEGTQ
ncbi:hypothetical protein [Pelagibius sp.]|uniref:hypothetical protein n=1 Tax=Pelagibius sp. TaxID=1931238 RepID=UPI002622B5A3|nr:hypothetical protein [Pelagibius sp.]